MRHARHYGGGKCSGPPPHPVATTLLHSCSAQLGALLCPLFVSRAARVSGEGKQHMVGQNEVENEESDTFISS